MSPTLPSSLATLTSQSGRLGLRCASSESRRVCLRASASQPMRPCGTSSVGRNSGRLVVNYLPPPSTNSYNTLYPSVVSPLAKESLAESGFGEDAFVVGLVRGDYVGGAVVFLGVRAGAFAH